MATTNQILVNYQKDTEDQENRIRQLQARLNSISFSRLGAFAAEILFVAMMINQGFSWGFIVLMIVPLVVFALLVRQHAQTLDKLHYHQHLLWVYQNETALLHSAKNGYDHGDRYADENHPYSSDLDIFGTSTLYALVNRCNTSGGMDRLASNLQKPGLIAQIRQRQEATKELTQHIRATFHFRALLRSHKPDQLVTIASKLKKQLPEQLKFTEHNLLRFMVKVVPAVSMLLLLAAIAFGGILWKFLALSGLFNSAITLFFLRRINLLYNGFSGSSAALNDISGAVKWTEDIPWKSLYILDFFNQHQQNDQVSHQIRKLSSIIQSFDARLNIILGGLLNLFFLWDLRHSVALSNWHKQSAAPLMEGLERIGKFEELISLATLHYNQPDWTFPQLAPEFTFKARSLGHPLIPLEKRVSNDFELNVKPTTDIVTGSNMAGKSTFLRTAGINMVLAFSGAPVCAAFLQLSVFELLSYMRIKDSLNDQTSTFKAELNRLKMILDTTSTQKNSFVLIDEMLRGTNSKDKFLGSRVFIEKLISQQTPALFATHDLQLSEMELKYPQEIRNYHFDIQIEDGEMLFDYKLKQGPCKTFNAALLLREIGLTLS